MAETEPLSDLAQADDRPRRLVSARWVVVIVLLLAVASVSVANRLLTERFTESLRNRAELRLALFSGNIQGELQRTAVVPLLLARDPELVGALQAGEYSQTSARLMALQSEIGAASLQLLDASGRTVAATDRNQIGSSHREDPSFVAARRGSDTVFTVAEKSSGGFEFSHSRALRSGGRLLGVVVVAVDLTQFERGWSLFADAVAVTDSEGRIILATDPRWRGRTIDEALALGEAAGPWAQLTRGLSERLGISTSAWLRGAPMLRSEARVPFRGWRLVSFTPVDTARERVNGVLALVIMGFALLLAGAFYVTGRRARFQTALFARESAELRALNARLQREIAEREKAQKDLAVAEQTLEQSSKLAVLGEMSAAVSHELNQPLAAMKTYLAGARLLMQRRRPEEALSSFERIDDLIARMGAITRQLKSFARKGGDAFASVDMRACISGALEMMEPQLRARRVRLVRSVPREAVMVRGDRIRIEQVIVNLLRNALDATTDTPEPQIDILLSQGETATLTVRDNGHGLKHLDSLFEPFFTTKGPGDGVGLGLAISSGIVADHGGRLTARNAPAGGAVFEMQLPLEAVEDIPPTRAAE
ncbi:sensor histidine kinase [Rhodobaculum claviforme]|uniref:C4-dicarboxylate transport sensor protein DctB n=1 Tax=Rhodobaculum claviforme TaxID=1549854 RepID=A0A934TKA9_9RHOB|nr:ATP-binding protein [Rhodobaculum claviforme]MBK5927011.1 two-component system sensor histidine kinase [Rhodobaculum claviforme]